MTTLVLSGSSGGAKVREELLRQDSVGRVRTTAERRAMLLAEFDRSGVSGARFAKMAGINYQTFANWLHVRRRQEAGKAGVVKRRRAVTWIEAHPGPVTPASEALRVQLPGGAWMELRSPAELRTAALLLRELSGRGEKPC